MLFHETVTSAFFLKSLASCQKKKARAHVKRKKFILEGYSVKQ